MALHAVLRLPLSTRPASVTVRLWEHVGRGTAHCIAELPVDLTSQAWPTAAGIVWEVDCETFQGTLFFCLHEEERQSPLLSTELCIRQQQAIFFVQFFKFILEINLESAQKAGYDLAIRLQGIKALLQSSV